MIVHAGLLAEGARHADLGVLSRPPPGEPHEPRNQMQLCNVFKAQVKSIRFNVGWQAALESSLAL